MRRLSIDHSFNRTAYSLLEGKKLLCTGSFSLGHMSYENILEFKKFIDNLIETHKPDKVVTEKPSHMRNAEIARMLSGLHTVAVLSSVEHKLPYSIVNPKEMKKTVTGNGGATKEQVCDVLVKKYGYDEELLKNITYYKKDKNKIKNIDYDESDSVGNAIFDMIKCKEIEQ